jgi:hypothetical protein
VSTSLIAGFAAAISIAAVLAFESLVAAVALGLSSFVVVYGIALAFRDR